MANDIQPVKIWESITLLRPEYWKVYNRDDKQNLPFIEGADGYHFFDINGLVTCYAFDVSLISQLSKNDLILLSRVLYEEARGDYQQIGEVAYQEIVKVIIRRMKSNEYPNTIPEVLTQKDAFSCLPKIKRNRFIYSTDFVDALIVTINSLSKYTNITEKGAIAYHSTQVEKPNSKYWKKRYLTKVLGNHLFYK